MNPIQLLEWQHQGYPRYHQNRANLVLHIVLVPLFIAGNVFLLVNLIRGSWLWSLAALLATVFSLALQGRGHRMEHVPVEPFTGPGQAVARVLFEQWITFPRFVLSGGWWRVLRRRRAPKISAVEVEENVAVNGYTQEFMAAWDRTLQFGLKLPPLRLQVRQDCIDMAKAMPVIVEYFTRHSAQELIGQTANIHNALHPRLMTALGVPLYLTIGWIELDGTPRMKHGDEKIKIFLTEKMMAWMREGVPFHLWFTSSAQEILDVTFALNLGRATSIEDCTRRVIYRPAAAAPGNPVYHSTLVGDDFFVQSGAALSLV